MECVNKYCEFFMELIRGRRLLSLVKILGKRDCGRCKFCIWRKRIHYE